MWWFSRSKSKSPAAETDESASPQEATRHPASARIIDLQQAVGHQTAREMIGKATADTSQSAGEPLAHDVRQGMEARFGADLSMVRVHTDGAAAESAEALRADAYTRGREIYFGAGKYAPKSADGQQLLAHELTHVIQQGGHTDAATQAFPEAVSQPGDAAEREADSVSQALASAQPAPKIAAVTSPSVVHRQPAKEEKLPSAKIPQPATARVMKQYIKGIGRPEINELIKDKHMWWEDPRPFPIKTATINGVPHVWEWTVQLYKPSSISGKGDFETPSPTTTTRKGTPGTPDTVVHSVTTRVPEGTGPNTAAESMFHELIHIRIFIDRELPVDERSQTFNRYNLMLEVANTPLLIPTGSRIKNKTKEVLELFARVLRNPALMRIGNEQYYEGRVEVMVNEKFSGQEAKKIWQQPGAANLAAWRTKSNADIASRYAFATVTQIQQAVVDTLPNGSRAVPAAMAQPTPGDQSHTGGESLSALQSELEKAILELFNTIDHEMEVLQDIREHPEHVTHPPGVTIPPPSERRDYWPKPAPLPE